MLFKGDEYLKRGSMARLLAITLTFLLFLGLQAAHASDGREDILIPVKVERGICLIKLARKFCNRPQDWVEIANVNNLKPPYKIGTNSYLLVPLRLLNIEIVALKVENLTGKAYLLTKEHQKKSLREGDIVLPGTIVVTQEDSQLELVLPRGRRITVKPEAMLEIVYVIRLVDGSLKAGFLLEKGRLLNIIQEKLPPGDIFEIKTPVALTGVRGTQFRVKLPQEDASIIESLHGVVSVAASGKKIALPEGKGSIVKKGEPPSKPVPLPPVPAVPKVEPIYRVLPMVIKTNEGPYQTLHITIVKNADGHHFVTERFVSPGEEVRFAQLEDAQYALYLTGIDDKGLESPPSRPLHFTVRTKPAAPIISYPRKNFETWENSVTVEWLKVDGAVSYRVMMAKDSKFKELVDETDVEKPVYLAKGLQPGTYFFKVASVASDGFQSLFSNVVSWKVLPKPEKAKMKEENDTIYLQWASAGEGITYEIQMAKDKDFKNIIFHKKGLVKASFALKKPKRGGTYFVRIRSVNASGQKSDYSAPQTFEIEKEPCGYCGYVCGTVAAILLGIIIF